MLARLTEKAERRRHRAEENMGEQLLVAAAVVELVRTEQSGHAVQKRALARRLS